MSDSENPAIKGDCIFGLIESRNGNGDWTPMMIGDLVCGTIRDMLFKLPPRDELNGVTVRVEIRTDPEDAWVKYSERQNNTIS